MAQVSYGTITITDTNDIEEIFSLYGGSNDVNTSPTYSYAAVTDGTTWKRNVTAITNYKYIWQITAITKTGITVDSSNWQQFYGAPIRITGEEGDDARNIIAVTPYYYLSSSNSSQTGGNWSTSPQAYPSTGVYYYWTKTITTYDSGSPLESTPVLDMFLTNAAKDARDANTTAALANSIAQHANEDAQGAMSQAASNVNEVKRIWYAQAAATPVPAAPTTGITTSTTHDAWSITKPAANESYQYYFYCDQTKTGGGVYSWSEVILDTSTLSQYQIGAMSAKVRNYWWDSAGAHIAGGTSTSGEISATSPTSSYGYNTLTGLTGISFKYNDAKVVDLNSTTPSLDFYQPPTISGSTVTQGKKTMMLSANALRFYDPSDGTTEQAKLDTNGLVLSKGGIKAGTSRTNDFIYLSSANFADTISGHNAGTVSLDNYTATDWRQLIGTKFGVRADGTLYANNAVISGTITVGSGSTIDSGATIGGTTILSDVVTNAAAGAQASEDLEEKADKTDSVYRTQQIYYRSIERIAEPLTIANNIWLSTSGTGYENWSLEMPSANKEEYNLSTDVEIDTNKRYYTRSATTPYVYTLVNNPDSSLLNTYYELQIIAYAYLYTAIQTQTVAQYDNGSDVECFCSVPVLDEGAYDATKYITKIDNYGIKIHSFDDSNGEIDESNYVSIGTAGLQFFKGDTNESVATFGEFVQIGKSSNFHITLDVNDNNGELGFYQGDTKVAYINNNQLYITQSVVLEQMDLGTLISNNGFGQWSWKVHPNGQSPSRNNLNLKWVG